MKVLVIGKSGQVASSVRQIAASFSAGEFIFVGRPELDLADSASIRNAIGSVSPHVILNTAAFTAVDDAESDFAGAERINAIAPGVIAAAARSAGSRLIHLSTDYVFSGTEEEPYQETSHVCPVNVYGKTKLAGEQAVRAELEDHLIIRTAWVYSPFGKNFVKTILKASESRDVLRVVHDQVGSPSCALDLAEGLLTILRHWDRDPDLGIGRTYHLAGQEGASWADVAKEVMAASGEFGGPTAEVVPITTEEWPTPARRPKNARLDSRHFKATFGHALPPWKDSVHSVVKQLLQA